MTDTDTHPRTLLRRFVRDRLIGRTLAGERVSTNPGVPVGGEGSYELRIHDRAETVETFEEAPRSYERSLTLAVDCYAERSLDFTDDQSLDERVDALAWEVERILSPLLPSHDLGACGISVVWEKTGFASLQTDFGADGERVEGGCRLEWTVAYVTSHHREGAGSLEDLETVAVDLDSDQGDDPEAADEIAIDQS